MDFFKKIFQKNKNNLPKEEHSNKKLKNCTPKEINLNNVKYIPLPPSPKSWDIDGRNEFHQEYKIPEIREVYNESYQKKYTNVIKKSLLLSEEQLKLNIGKEVLKAYRQIIFDKFKANQLKTAGKWSSEMLSRVEFHCNDTDKRRHNKIINDLEKNNIKHPYNTIEIKKEEVELFEIDNNQKWKISSIIKMKKNEKLDPSFKLVNFIADGIIYINKNKKSDIAKNIYQSEIMKYDLEGNIVAKKQISHNIYRQNNNPKSSNIAIMDDEGVLYIYDKNINLSLEKDLKSDIRILQHLKENKSNYWGDFKSQIRAIDVNMTSDKILFTVADEIWCSTFSGSTYWGARTPLNEGWERFVGKGDTDKINPNISNALKCLGLELPVSPLEIKKQYRIKAQKYHPDVNKNSNANEMMQKINEAFETLTGINPEILANEEYKSDEVFYKKTKPDFEFTVENISFQMTSSLGVAQDWIYEASFSSESENVFIGTYSGKIIELDSSGNPLKVFDIGTVPSQIIESGQYLYISSNTRLYIIKDKEKLVGFVDIFQQGRLIISKSGFGLLSDKILKWYTQEGINIGSIKSKDPIKSIYSLNNKTIIETMQNKAVIEGLVLI
ncbi:DnaJ domain-containing protein [Aliarcobacter skirrowii]|uniref:J domain-containing protein n=1 Tax=Aliarcobacter skirrowii TaxID=28200 RepID=UPI0029BA150A|nr:DnaJ domain-containing protein [Aliarcobacter skirrowii]MDX4060725.1 DnaJ domain-containing protein [Aliarcobacter skirrowii]